MKPRKKPNVLVNRRDSKILEYLFKNKGSTLRKITQVFFNGGSQCTASIRLGKLVKIGLIEKVPFMSDDGLFRVFYRLANKGVEIVQKSYPHKITKNYYISDSIEHDLILSEITEVISGFRMVSQVITESELLSCHDYFEDFKTRPFVLLRSDRLLVIKAEDKDFYVSLEYENSLKSNDRNQKKIEDYYRNRNVDAVFYVCRDSKIMKALMELDQSSKGEKSSKFYFCLLKDVQSSKGELTFKKSDHAYLTLKQGAGFLTK